MLSASVTVSFPAAESVTGAISPCRNVTFAPALTTWIAAMLVSDSGCVRSKVPAPCRVSVDPASGLIVSPLLNVLSVATTVETPADTVSLEVVR